MDNTILQRTFVECCPPKSKAEESQFFSHASEHIKKSAKEPVSATIKKQEQMNYILHSHLFKFDASINIIPRQSHDVTVETSSELRYTKRTAKIINKTNSVFQKSMSRLLYLDLMNPKFCTMLYREHSRRN